MKLTNISRKRLIENAGIFKEGSTDRDAIAHFVWGRDEFMEKSEDEIEGLIDTLEKEYNASKGNYSNVDDYIEELEQSGGLEGMLSEIQYSESDKQALTSAIQSLGQLPGLQGDDLAQAIEDGYYALTDNLPNLVNDLAKAARAVSNVSPQAKAIMQKELKIYRDIEALLNSSVLGAVL